MSTLKHALAGSRSELAAHFELSGNDGWTDQKQENGFLTALAEAVPRKSRSLLSPASETLASPIIFASALSSSLLGAPSRLSKADF